MFSSRIPLQGKGISEAKKCKKDRVDLLVTARVKRGLEKVLAWFCLSASFSHSILKICSTLTMNSMEPGTVSTLNQCALRNGPGDKRAYGR